MALFLERRQCGDSSGRQATARNLVPSRQPLLRAFAPATQPWRNALQSRSGGFPKLRPSLFCARSCHGTVRSRNPPRLDLLLFGAKSVPIIAHPALPSTRYASGRLWRPNEPKPRRVHASGDDRRVAHLPLPSSPPRPDPSARAGPLLHQPHRPRLSRAIRTKPRHQQFDRVFRPQQQRVSWRLLSAIRSSRRSDRLKVVLLVC